MSYTSGIMDIENTGHEAIVHIHSWALPSDSEIDDCRQELVAYFDAHHPEVLSFDLESVAIIPSTMLGMLLTIHQCGVRIRIVNPSEHVLAVLEVTKLSTKFEVIKSTRSE